MPVFSVPVGTPTPSLPTGIMFTVPVALTAAFPKKSNALAVAEKVAPTVWVEPNSLTVKYSTPAGTTLMLVGPLTVIPVAAIESVVRMAFVSVTEAVPGFVPVNVKAVGMVGALPFGELTAPVIVTLIVPE